MADLVTTAASRSNSSGRIPLFGRIKSLATMFTRMMRHEPSGEVHARDTFDDLDQIVADFEAQTGKMAADCSVVEIGFGTRPYRAYGLSAYFKRVAAIDLDSPILSVRDVPRTFRRNGPLRGTKSLVRHVLFDRRSWPGFHREARARSLRYNPESVQLVIGSAGSAETWAQIDFRPDFIFSTDVFEHIPGEELPPLLREMRERLTPGGMVITRPFVFTGIAGGHDLYWSPYRVDQNDGATAWNHLLDPDFTVDTYLNRLRRSDYVKLFRDAGFEVLRDHATSGRLGEQYLTPEKRAALSAYDDYELFSNLVEFWLK